MLSKSPIFYFSWLLLIFLGPVQSVLAIGTYEITPEMLLKKIESGDAGLIIDLRKQQKYQFAHVPTATNIWFKEINEKIHQLTPYKQETITLYCADGTQSAIVMVKLRKQGFNKIFNLHGNMNAWLRKKLPIDTIKK